MTKLTKVLRLRIEYALRNAERAHRYIHDPKRALCIHLDMATTTLDYTRPDGAVLTEVAKHSSDIVGLESAIAELRAILTERRPND